MAGPQRLVVLAWVIMAVTGSVMLFDVPRTPTCSGPALREKSGGRLSRDPDAEG